MPNVFISYSWEDKDHKKWVGTFAEELLKNGIEATIDQYDLTLGDRLPQFMEQSINNADFVLIVCTPSYKEKSDNRKGGVGYEGHIISAELMTKGNERKFIPIIRKGDFQTSLPIFLAGKLSINLSEGSDYEENFMDLVTTLWGGKRKPAIGIKPSYVEHANPYKNKRNEPVHILEIVMDEVTEPKMDGSRGCALYKIPFRLSKHPSELWKKLFLQAWQFPSSFTTMHRPGIASVYGDEIILDGTTMEEVRDYHKATLLLCVDEANKREVEILEAEQKRKEKEENQRKQHHTNVEKISRQIMF